MSNEQAPKIRRAGAYIVKAAESRPSKARSSSNGQCTGQTPPSSADKRLARALLKKRS